MYIVPNVLVSEKGITLFEQIRPKEEHTVWEPGDPKEIAVVKRIFDLRVRLHYGYRMIAKVLNAEGIPCAQRGKWSNRDQKWATGTIYAMIQNPAYRGARVYDRKKKNWIGRYAPRYKQNDQSKWSFVENAHEAIIDPELWALANALSPESENGKKAKIRFENPYLLSGLMKCSHCGFSFSGRTQQVGRPGNRKKRRTYVDSGNISKGSSVCSFMSIDAVELEGRVLEEIKKSITSLSSISMVTKIVEDYLDYRFNSKESDLARIENEIQRVSRSINSLLSIAEKGINLDEVIERLQVLKEEKTKLENLKKNYMVMDRTKSYNQSIVEKIAEFFSNFEQHFERAPRSEQKALVAQMVEKIVVDRKTRTAKVYILKLPKQELGNLNKGNCVPLMAVLPTRDKNKERSNLKLIQCVEISV